MSDLVGNPEDRFSHVEAQIIFLTVFRVQCSYIPGIYETDINGVDYYVLHFTEIGIYQTVPIGQCG